MLKPVTLKLSALYIPVKRRNGLEADRIDALAEEILEDGQKVPIQVRQGDGRYVLVPGLHRLEACRALGEEKITCIFVAARKS